MITYKSIHEERAAHVKTISRLAARTGQVKELRRRVRLLRTSLQAFLDHHEGDYEVIPEVKRAGRAMEATK